MKRSTILLFFAFILLFASCTRNQNGREQNIAHTIPPTGVALQHRDQSSDESKTNSDSEVPHSSPTPVNEQSAGDTAQPPLMPSVAENPAFQEEKPLIDFAGLNNLAKSLKEQGLDDNSVILSTADSLSKYFIYNDILQDLAVADIDADSLDEIVIVYGNEENPETENLLSVIRWWDGRFETYGDPKSFNFFIAEIHAVDLITDGKPEIFIIDDRYEYPEFKLLGFQEAGWAEYDLHALGIIGVEQFIDVSWETLQMGHRVTDGFYSWEQYQWDGEQFVINDSYTYDNRIEFYEDQGCCDPITDTSDEE